MNAISSCHVSVSWLSVPSVLPNISFLLLQLLLPPIPKRGDLHYYNGLLLLLIPVRSRHLVLMFCFMLQVCARIVMLGDPEDDEGVSCFGGVFVVEFSEFVLLAVPIANA